ncbi:RNA-directed DNA polymerase from mobile element jockey [Eumeta japonica]|uniref:RNA-directed DNA polymerase from mobile element jockey n=1 Tax=Eumeta variegata TaxID=151549 RepID=A0A4C1Z454_EUMVA|nr:RNA-directed DNA polymerase from mobile element jockey [Eumeta japonica]
MASIASGTAKAEGTTSASKTLPLGELKIIFFKFLEQQGYALPSEVDSVLGVGTSDSADNKNKYNVGGRGQSPCLSVCSSGKRSSSAISSNEGSDNSDSTVKGSDDEDFQIVKRKNKRVARRLHKTSSSSQSNDSAMDVEQVKVKLTNHSDSSITSKKATVAKTVASNKEATTSGINTLKTTNVAGSKPSPPPKVNPPPQICLRDKSKWNHIASECNRLHINYNKAQNTRNGINITMSSIDDFRKLYSYLIKSGIPFHTYALEEECKVKAVLKGVPVEIETEDIKADLVRQEYPVQAVHRMHHRDGTALGLVLAILNKTDGIPGQCHRCQLYGHAVTNCHAPPRCVKCLDPHWTKECTRTRDSEGKPACCNCGSDHTANYGGCPAAPKPKPKSSYNKNITKVQQTSRPLDVSHFPALNSGNKQTARTVPTKPTGSKNFHPAPAPKENQWKNPLHGQGAPKGGTALYYRQTLSCSPIDIPPLTNLETTGCRLTMSSHGAIIIISVYLPPKKELLRSDVETLFALGDAVILFGDLNSKSTKWRCNYTNANGRKMIDLAKDLHFDVIAPSTQTYFPDNVRNRPDILDIALMRGVALNVRCIETLQSLNSDHRPVLLKVGPPDGEQPPKNKIITSWRKVSLLLEETDTPILNNIPDNIETTDEIDYAIGALTNHIATVVEDSSREVPAADNRRKLPEDVRVLLRAKNAAMRRASTYPTCENRSCARALQRKVKARIQEFKNDKWSTLMEEITPSHQAYWKLAKALKSDGYLPTPALRKPDNTFAVDDRGKAECLADSIEQQCSNNSIHDATHSRRIEEEVRTKISLEPQDDLAPASVDEIQKHIKALKTKKAPGLNAISNKAIKCISLPLMALLVAIFNACFKNCYFPPIWKEAVVIGLPKPGKPRDLPASYRPISLLSGLGKLFEKTIKTRLSEHLIGKGLIINEQFGFRPNHSCPQQVHRLVEHKSEGFKKKRKAVAVFFDVAKAFDRVWHAGLIHKLYTLELPDRLVLIIHNYLNNRNFTFRHENTYSTKRTLKAGVPQGSTLSPLLYSAYVNDIPRSSNGVQLALFADDTALY